jgi:hypothetical protein
MPLMLTLSPPPLCRHRLQMWHKLSGWWAIWGFTATYMPGCAVTLLQLVLRRTDIALPRWMRSWLAMRKQLGVLSLWVLCIHLILSACLFGPNYWGSFYDRSNALVPAVNGSTVNAWGLQAEGERAHLRMPTYGPVSAIHMHGHRLLCCLLPSLWPNSPPLLPRPRPRRADVVPSKLVVPINAPIVISSPAANDSANASALELASGGGSKGGNSTKAAPLVVLQQASVFSPGARMNLKGEGCTLLGVLSTILFFIPALTSLPGVGSRLNWREWHLLQSQIGWLAFAAGTAHVLVVGLPNGFPAKWSWPAGQILPGLVTMASGPAMFVIGFKVLTMLPPVSWALAAIRSGRWAKDSQQFAVYCME